MREVGGTTGIRRRGRRWLLPKTNWEALKISQPRLGLLHRARCCFFPHFSLARPCFYYHSASLVPPPFSQGAIPFVFVSTSCFFFIIIPSTISCVASFTLFASRRSVFYSDSKYSLLGLCLFLPLLLHLHYPARSNDTHVHLCIIAPD